MGLDIAEEKDNKFEDTAIEYVNIINSRVHCILVRNKFCLPLVKYLKSPNSSHSRRRLSGQK